MARRRYQQGIGVPDTLGAPLGEWKDPTPVTTKPFDMSVPNTGASRNYGNTGAYVDTVPHRWKVGESTASGAQIAKNLQTRAQNRQIASSAGMTVDEATSVMREARAIRASDRISRGADVLRSAVADRAGTPVPPSEAEDFDTVAERESRLPPPTGTGRPVPRPPSGGAPTAPAGTPPLDTTPFPPRRAREFPNLTEYDVPDISTAGHPLDMAIRSAPDGPAPSNVNYRDDPAMDTPLLPMPRSVTPDAQEEAMRNNIFGPRGTDTGPSAPDSNSRNKKRGRGKRPEA